MSLGALIGGITRDLVSSCAYSEGREAREGREGREGRRDREGREGREAREGREGRRDRVTECVVCFENDARVACVPCGHMCLCVLDAPRVGACPICRAPIAHRLTVFD